MRRSVDNLGWIVGLGIILWLLVPGWALAQQHQNQREVATVYAIGSSPIVGDDMSASRNQAIDDALVAAVYQVLTDIMPRDALATGFQAINETVFTRKDNYINDYRVLTESVHGRAHRLLIEAGVSVPLIKAALKTAGIWEDRKGLPRVLICIAEKLIDGGDFQYWWGGPSSNDARVATLGVSRAFNPDQFLLLDPLSRGVPQTEYPPDLNADQAVTLGRLYGADVVVAGIASAESTPNTLGGMMRSFRGTVALKTFRVSDGVMIATSQTSALIAAEDSTRGGRQAMANAADQVGSDISRKILEAWRSEGAGDFQLELRVGGIGGYMASYVKFRGALSTMSGVDSVQLKEMTASEALLTVAYQGNARSLADALLLMHFDTFGLNISEVGPSGIVLQLVPR